MIEALKQTRLTPTQLEKSINVLISEGRIPLFCEGRQGPEVNPDLDSKNPYLPGSRSRKVVYCFIPPEGTQSGDSYRRRFGGVEFLSPNGESRGFAELYTLTPKRGAELQAKIKSIPLSR